MSPPQPRPAASIWNRFWSPKSFLEQIPPEASADEAKAIEHRNNVWLRTYMDMYILRWGGLWAASSAAAVLMTDASAPAEDLEEHNENIVGLIEVIREFKA